MKMPPAAEIEQHVLSMIPVRTTVDEVAREVELEARLRAYQHAFDSGQYAAGVGIVPTPGPEAIVRAADRKSAWIEDGTGIYGPHHTPIVPVRGKFLVFQVKGGAPAASMSGRRTTSGLIFAPSAKGRPASHVMRDAARAVAERFGLRFTDNRRS